jgi:hypothetical protein
MGRQIFRQNPATLAKIHPKISMVAYQINIHVQAYASAAFCINTTVDPARDNAPNPVTDIVITPASQQTEPSENHRILPEKTIRLFRIKPAQVLLNSPVAHFPFTVKLKLQPVPAN